MKDTSDHKRGKGDYERTFPHRGKYAFDHVTIRNGFSPCDVVCSVNDLTMFEGRYT